MRKNIKIVATTFFCLFLALTARVAYIQCINGEKLSVMAEAQYSHKGNINELNYMILDDEGKSLLKYNEKYKIVIDTVSFKRNNNVTPMEELYAFNYILKNYNKDYDVVKDLKNQKEGKLYYEVDEDTYKNISELKAIRGIYSYKYNSLDKNNSWNICNMLTNIKNKDGELKDRDFLEGDIKEYTSNNEEPTISFSKDNLGEITEGIYNIPKDNVNIKMTLNKDMIEKIKTVLDNDKYKNYGQIGVALCESTTGKVKALTQKDDKKPNIMLGSATENGYSPGSIFKLIVLEAALNEGIVSLDDQYTCTYNPKFPCKTGHGNLTIEQGLIRSCNNTFVEIGNKLGGEKIIKYAMDQGFFTKTLNFYGENEAKGDYLASDLNRGGTTNISIGQNMRIAPIQALGMINTIINKGNYVKPYIISSLEDNSFNIIKTFSPEIKKEVIKASVASTMKSELTKVVKDPNGTGKGAYIKDLDMGGKTGTATRMEPKKDSEGNIVKDQNGNNLMEKHYDGWFAGYYKFKGQTYSLVVFVENIKDEEAGGTTAAPIFKEIVEKLIDNK